MEVAKKAGIAFDESKAHDALYDIEVTRELFWRLRSRVNSLGSLLGDND